MLIVHSDGELRIADSAGRGAGNEHTVRTSRRRSCGWRRRRCCFAAASDLKCQDREDARSGYQPQSALAAKAYEQRYDDKNRDASAGEGSGDSPN
jgi:hypothetical protein